MRTLHRFIAIAVILGLMAPQMATAQVSVSIGFNAFYGHLSPYGSWVNVASYGTVWRPTVAYAWRPYSSGHWVYSDVGWMWVTDEPWGWATYHYGRWILSPEGWCWVPGAVWAPSWVSWYVGPRYIGWAPLGPVGYAAVPAAYCSFVPSRSFLAVNVGAVCIPPAQNLTIIRNTTFVNNINVVNNTTIVNNGPGIAAVQQATGQTVAVTHIVSQNVNPNTLATSGVPPTQVRGNQLFAFRPTVQPPAAGTANTPLLTSEATSGQVFLGNKAANFRPTSAPTTLRPNVGPNATLPPLSPQLPPGQRPPLSQPRLMPNATPGQLTPPVNQPRLMPNASTGPKATPRPNIVHPSSLKLPPARPSTHGAPPPPKHPALPHPVPPNH